MNRRKTKVSNINRGPRLNLGMVVFLFIFLYILVSFLFYLKKDHFTLYQVTESGIAQNNTFNGLILRSEKVYKAPSAGYVAYYVTNGSRIAVDDTVYSIDESGDSLKELSSDKSITISDNEYYQLKNTVSEFSKDFKKESFGNVYTFKNTLDNKVFDITSGARYTNLEKLINNSKSSTLEIVKSKKSGTISYYIDGLESLKKDDVTTEYFDNYEYKYTKLTTGDLLEKKAPAYKVMTSDTWNIIINLSNEQYDLYKDMKVVNITFNNKSLKASADISCYEKDGGYFACLTLYRYAVQFIEDRFVSFDIETNSANGLKIPNSSILDKDFYVVPKKLVTKGGDKNSLGITVLVKNEDSTEYKFISTDIYNETDDSYYINPNQLEGATVAQYPDSNQTYTLLSQTDSLEGVYIANNGYCEFRRVEVMYKNDEYSIINKSTKYGLSVYDNIVLDATTADEDLIIY